MEVIALHDIRKEVDAKYVGFMPNGGAIKPVHIAGGSLRCIYGKCNTSKGIKKLALVADSKGNIPNGNEIEYTENVSKMKKLRNLSRQVLLSRCAMLCSVCSQQIKAFMW